MAKTTGKQTSSRSTRRTSSRRSAQRPDKSVEAFRNALEESVTLSRERIQEVLDDAVRRGRMTRGDANELLSKLVARGRKQTEELLRELERRARQARRGVGTHADTLRRRAGVKGGFPITGYDDLTAAQVVRRLDGMSRPDLRKVRTRERNGKARKTILKKIDAKLDSA